MEQGISQERTYLSDFQTIVDLLHDIKGHDRIDLERILLNRLSEEDRKHYQEVVSGIRLPDLHTDIVAKAIFDPNAYPDRVNYLIRKIMKDDTLAVNESFVNEGYRQSVSAKKVIFDIPFKLVTKTAADIEFQKIAQEFIFNRADIYGSDILLMQYSADPGQSKSEVDYNNVKDVLMIILMKESPKIFQSFQTEHYIHRFVERQADSGLSYTPLVKTVYIELDKCLTQFLKGTNGEPDNELQLLLSEIADINNPQVSNAVLRQKNGIEYEIRQHVERLSQDKEVQMMLLAEKYAQTDFVSYRNQFREEGREEAMNEFVAYVMEQNHCTREEAERIIQQRHSAHSAG